LRAPAELVGMATASRFDRFSDRLVTVVAMALLGFGGLAVGIVSLTAAAVGLQSAGVELTPLRQIVLSLTFIQGVGLAVVGLAYVAVRDRAGLIGVRVPTGRDLLWVAAGVVALFVLVFAAGLLLQALGLESNQNAVVDLARQDPSILLVMIPAAFLVIGPAEELLFRGIIQGRLRTVFGPAPAILVASVIFGLAHLTAYAGGSGDVSAVAVPVGLLSVLSVIFGVAYERTGNLVVPALIHGAYDAILFSLLYFVLRYGGGATAGALAV